MKPLHYLLGLLMVFLFTNTKGQETVELSNEYKRNTIKWNLTPMVWSTRNISLSYERVLKPHRSFSVNLGFFELPTVGLLDDVLIDNTTKKGGFAVSGDYRFYFKNRNTRAAPDGLYWGPYGSMHYYQFKHDMTFVDNPTIQGTAHLGANLSIYSAGVQLGYQFVIKERLAVDLIFLGPSFSVYALNVELTGVVDVDEEDEYLQALYDIMVSKVPGFEQLIQDGELTNHGVTTTWGAGMRYMVQIGYRF